MMFVMAISVTVSLLLYNSKLIYIKNNTLFDITILLNKRLIKIIIKSYFIDNII